MSPSNPHIAKQLRDKAFDHDTHVSLQQDLHNLARYIVSALLFQPDTDQYLDKRVYPLMAKLLFNVGQIYDNVGCYADADQQSKNLLADFLPIGEILHSDLEAALLNDPATHDPLEVVFCYPGFRAISYHRIAHVLYRHKIPLLPRMLSELAHQDTGIDIHPGARIGGNFFIDHGTGVVIGETAEIGSNVTIYQGVTLGAKRFYRDESGQVIKGEARHPVLGDGVTVYSGATILGRIVIGDRSVIGGNVWLTESVPAASKITQQPYLTNYFIDGDGI